MLSYAFISQMFIIDCGITFDSQSIQLATISSESLAEAQFCDKLAAICHLPKRLLPYPSREQTPPRQTALVGPFPPPGLAARKRRRGVIFMGAIDAALMMGNICNAWSPGKGSRRV